MISYIYKQDRYVRTVRIYRFVLCLNLRYAYVPALGARRMLRERAATPVLAARRATRVVISLCAAQRLRVRALLHSTQCVF